MKSSFISKFSEEKKQIKKRGQASLFYRMGLRNKRKQGFGNEYFLKDKTKIYATELKPGGAVVIASTNVCLPIGQYEMLNGDFLIIGSGGVIGFIMTKDKKIIK